MTYPRYRVYLNCSIVKFEDYIRKKRFFHSLTSPRYKQFGTKLSPFFGFVKSSKYKTIFKLSLIPKLLVACVGSRHFIPTIFVLVLPTIHFLNIFQICLILQFQCQNHSLHMELDNRPNYKFFQYLNYTFSKSQQKHY